jgi:hypothetical protein
VLQSDGYLTCIDLVSEVAIDDVAGPGCRTGRTNIWIDAGDARQNPVCVTEVKPAAVGQRGDRGRHVGGPFAGFDPQYLLRRIVAQVVIALREGKDGRQREIGHPGIELAWRRPSVVAGIECRNDNKPDWNAAFGAIFVSTCDRRVRNECCQSKG